LGWWWWWKTKGDHAVGRSWVGWTSGQRWIDFVHKTYDNAEDIGYMHFDYSWRDVLVVHLQECDIQIWREQDNKTPCCAEPQYLLAEL
jgi:hypothetical protein